MLTLLLTCLALRRAFRFPEGRGERISANGAGQAVECRVGETTGAIKCNSSPLLGAVAIGDHLTVVELDGIGQVMGFYTDSTGFGRGRVMASYEVNEPSARCLGSCPRECVERESRDGRTEA